MPVKVEIRLDAQSMTEFMIYHIYTGMVGILTLVLGVLNVALTVVFAMQKDFLLMALFLFFAALIWIAFPYFIKIKVTNQMKSSRRLNVPVTYTFDESGVETITPDDSGKASWGKFKRAVSRKGILILYDAAKRAIILPVDQLGENYTGIVDMIYANMPAPAVRIRRLDQKR